MIKSRRQIGRKCSTYGREVHTGLYWENLRVGDQLEDPDVDGRIILNWIIEKLDGGGAGLIWLRIGTGGGLLCIR
jgi:hypothetical protein